MIVPEEIKDVLPLYDELVPVLFVACDDTSLKTNANAVAAQLMLSKHAAWIKYINTILIEEGKVLAVKKDAPSEMFDVVIDIHQLLKEKDIIDERAYDDVRVLWATQPSAAYETVSTISAELALLDDPEAYHIALVIMQDDPIDVVNKLYKDAKDMFTESSEGRRLIISADKVEDLYKLGLLNAYS